MIDKNLLYKILTFMIIEKCRVSKMIDKLIISLCFILFEFDISNIFFHLTDWMIFIKLFLVLLLTIINKNLNRSVVVVGYWIL